MRQLIVDAIVLKRRNIGEADRIVTLFTKQYVKIQVKAIGVRKISSRRSSHIEPLNEVRCSLYKGKGMPILTEIATGETYADIKRDLQRVGFAYHLCELVDGLCPEGQENTQIFFLLKNTLIFLAEENDNIASIVHQFEKQLLLLLGYLPTPQSVQTVFFIEGILERKLKTLQLLPKLLA